MPKFRDLTVEQRRAYWRESQNRLRAEETPEQRALRLAAKRADYLKHKPKRLATCKAWGEKHGWKKSVAAVARARERRRKVRELIAEIKSVPCADCKGTFPSYVMDFDHRDPLQKAYNIATRGAVLSREALMAEIAKCDIVCANCHRIRSHSAGRWGAHTNKLRLA